MLEIYDGPKTKLLKTTTSKSKHMVNPALSALHVQLLFDKINSSFFCIFSTHHCFNGQTMKKTNPGLNESSIVLQFSPAEQIICSLIDMLTDKLNNL